MTGEGKQHLYCQMATLNDLDVTRTALRELLPAATSAWLTYMVVDFLTHAVFLAPYWRATATYWLPPRELFRMIPLAYISFAIYCAASTWLLVRLYGKHPRVSAGVRFGAGAGFLFGAISALGSCSIFHMPVSALIVWPVSVTAESAAAVTAAAWVLKTERPWRRVGWVIAATMLLFILGVVTQNVLSSLIHDHASKLADTCQHDRQDVGLKLVRTSSEVLGKMEIAE